MQPQPKNVSSVMENDGAVLTSCGETRCSPDVDQSSDKSHSSAQLTVIRSDTVESVKICEVLSCDTKLCPEDSATTGNDIFFLRLI